ncbi:MAG: GNAT family protein, partial [Micropepsaceae bacterium]
RWLMSVARAPTTQAKPVYLETPHLYMRTLTVADASERWAAWFEQDDVRRGVNLPALTKTKADIVAYIEKFDQQSRLLWGIFDRTNDLMIGILTADIDWDLSCILSNTIVGEAAYRHRGVMLEVSPPFRTYFFETLGLKVITATVLATNKAIIGYVEKTGWTLHQELKGQNKSYADGSPIDLLFYALSRDSWEVWKAAHPAELQAMTIAAAPR